MARVAGDSRNLIGKLKFCGKMGEGSTNRGV